MLEMEWLSSEGVLQTLPYWFSHYQVMGDQSRAFLSALAAQREGKGEHLISDVSSRVTCSRLRKLISESQLNINIMPVLHHPIISIDNTAEKQNIYEVLVLNLPIPETNTPWEKIIEFRKDPESQHKLRALRVWVSDIAHQNFTISEVQEKLEYLLHEYRTSMDLHKIKAGSGQFQTALIFAAEFSENLLRLQLSKAIKGIFEIRNRKLALFEAEKSSPGREIAYIVKAQEEYK